MVGFGPLRVLVYESIIENGINEKYLPGVRLDGLAATMDLEAAVSNAEIRRFCIALLCGT